jgi:hypothetical protein
MPAELGTKKSLEALLAQVKSNVDGAGTVHPYSSGQIVGGVERIQNDHGRSSKRGKLVVVVVVTGRGALLGLGRFLLSLFLGFLVQLFVVDHHTAHVC